MLPFALALFLPVSLADEVGSEPQLALVLTERYLSFHGRCVAKSS